MANPIMMVPYRSYNKYNTNTANHTHTINRSDTDIHNDNSYPENQQLKRSAASPAVVATTTTKSWTMNLMNFLQEGHDQTKDDFADDAMYWCE
mmetsp:Transcript_24961/g.27970  ORF Transcript_24961/g.27970 Transcript_24961/m.27970 type:complete len:93 (+) Transcript_24961:156-434(+)